MCSKSCSCCDEHPTWWTDCSFHMITSDLPKWSPNIWLADDQMRQMGYGPHWKLKVWIKYIINLVPSDKKWHHKMAARLSETSIFCMNKQPLEAELNAPVKIHDCLACAALWFLRHCLCTQSLLVNRLIQDSFNWHCRKCVLEEKRVQQEVNKRERRIKRPGWVLWSS